MTISNSILASLAIVAVLALSACDDPETAKRALENMSMSDIKLLGYGSFYCGRDDSFSTKFTAKNQQGKIVTGAVCSGWSKGATVRFD